MAVELISPTLPGIQPRPGIRSVAGAVILTGRWVALDSSGKIVAPAASAVGLYFVFEGTHQHLGTTTDFDASGNSTVSAPYPVNNFNGACALLYGDFIASVGPEGVLQSDAANILPGTLLKVDTMGRLVSTTLAANDFVAKAESRVVDAGGKISSLTFRALR